MKTCLICQTQAADSSPTCASCGEGSFTVVTVTPKPTAEAEPEPAPKTEPTRRGKR